MDFVRFKSVACALFSISSLVYIDVATACTRILKVDENNAVLVGRTMDWFEDIKTNLMVYPKGMSRTGSTNNANSFNWTSNYGSIVATAYEHISCDGMNEAGFGTHILWLKDTDYGKPVANKPSMSIHLWMQYYLDNFKTVNEAVHFAEQNKFQILPLYHPGAKRWMNVHLVLDDATGDSAVIEYIDGQQKIYHDRKYIATTNEPSFDKQLQNLKKYKSFGGENSVPGTTSAADRFVRASYYHDLLPKASSLKQEFSGVLSVLNNVAQPYTIVTDDNPSHSATLWRSISDLTNKIYYIQSTDTSNMIQIDLNKFNLAKGAPVMKLDLIHHPEYIGDMTNSFVALNAK